MRKSAIIALCLASILCFSGCSQKEEAKEVKQEKQEEQAKPTPNLKGDTSVPKTGEDLTPEGGKECKSLAAACKEAGVTLSLPGHIDGFGTGEKYLSEEDTVTAVFFNKEGDSIRITKSKNDLSGMGDYGTTYQKESGGVTVSVGSRYGKKTVGKAAWEDGGYSYSIETDPWGDLPWKEASAIIEGIK